MMVQEEYYDTKQKQADNEFNKIVPSLIKNEQFQQLSVKDREIVRQELVKKMAESEEEVTDTVELNV